jgi:tight adherence protein B
VILASLMAALFVAIIMMKILSIAGIKSSWDVSDEILTRMNLIGAVGDDEQARDIRIRARYAPFKRAHIFLSGHRFFRDLASDLQMSGSKKLTVFSFLCLCAALAAGVWVIGDFLRLWWPSMAAVSAAAAYAPFLVVRTRKSAYVRNFESQLPNALGMMAGCIKAGHTVESSLDVLSRHSPQPAAAEFAHVRAMVKMGQGLTAALGKLNQRMPSSDICFLISAVTLQQKTGGSLAECLRNLEVKMRDRVMLRREVKALSAEGRLTIWVLACLPPVILGYQYFTGSSALRNFVASDLGRWIMAACFVVQGAGVLWARKIVRIV